MSLPIILAIVLTTAILAWGAVYLVVRHQREAALNKAFQNDPIDADIGREALRRVFGILSDEDPTPPPVVRTPPALTPGVMPQASMAASQVAPFTLGPAMVKPAEPEKPAIIPAAAIAAAAAPMVAAAITPPAPAPVAPPPAPAAMIIPPPAPILAAAPPSVAPVLPPPAPAAPARGGFRLFAPRDGEKVAPAGALLATSTAVSGAPGLPVPTSIPVKADAPPKTAGSGGGRRGYRGNQRPRFIRDSLGALLVTGGIVIVAVAVLHPQLSFFTGGVSPATATAPAIGAVTFVPVKTASPSPSDSPSPSPSPSPTPVVTPVPTPRPTPVPTPVPTPTPKPTPTPAPTPTPVKPIVISFNGTPTGLSVQFSGSYSNGTTWTINPGDGTAVHNGSGAVTWTHVYALSGDYYPTLTAHKGKLNSYPQSIHLSL